MEVILRKLRPDLLEKKSSAKRPDVRVAIEEGIDPVKQILNE